MVVSEMKRMDEEKNRLQSPRKKNTRADASANDDDQPAEGNAGWADSIAKVLSTTKPKTKKSLVLSRAKKIKPDTNITSAATENNFGFEVEGSTEIKEEKPAPELLDEKVKQRRNVQLALRVKPSWKDIERERTLRKVATKGVVQLFNAVRMQQKELQQKLDDVGPLDSRKEAVLNNINKRKFLDVLMSGSRAKSEAVDNSVKSEHKTEHDSSDSDADDKSKKKSEWNVLREDFMTNKKVKHWDEEDSDDSSQSANANESPDDNGH